MQLQNIRQKEGFMMVIAFLMGVSSLLSANAQDLAKNRKLKPQDSTLYIRALVGGSNTQNLLEGINNSEIGVTNINGQTLNSDRYFIIDSITINYGVDLVATLPKAVDYNLTLPPALRNANLLIRQDNEVVLSIPVSDINDAKSTDFRFRELQAYALLRDQKTITIEIEFPAGGDLAPGAGNAGFAEVLLRGFETYVKR